MKGSILIPQKGGLGARHLSSALEAAGHRPPKLYFLNKVPAQSRYDEKELNGVRDAVEDDRWIGISVSAIGLERTRQLIKLIRNSFPAKPILVGGVQALATPELFYGLGADAVCRQEGEIWLPEALDMIKKGRDIPSGFETQTPRHDLIMPPDYDFTKGTHFMLKDGSIRKIARAEDEFEAIENFSICGPQYPLWLFTDRRCRFTCTYCINHKLKDFDRTHGGPPGRLGTLLLLRQVKDMISRYPLIDYIVFFDDDFLLRFRDSKEELDMFCETWMHRVRKPFFIYFSPMTFSEDILNRLIDAGCRQVNFGYQSCSHQEYYHRPFTSFNKIKRITGFTAGAAAEGHIGPPEIDFLINSPFESAEDMRLTIEAILRLHPPFDTQMHSLRLFPGYRLTELFSRDIIPLPGYRTVLDREFQDHRPHSVWLWPNIEDDRAYYTIIQMLMTGLCTDEKLGVLKRRDVEGWLDLPAEKRRSRMDELRHLFDSNPRIRYYDELAR